MPSRTKRTRPPTSSMLGVEQLEDRVLLSSSGPLQSSIAMTAPPAAQVTAGSASHYNTAVVAAAAAGLTHENGNVSHAYASAQGAKAVYSDPDGSSSTANSHDGQDAYEYKTVSDDAMKAQPAPRVDVSVVMAADRVNNRNMLQGNVPNPTAPSNLPNTPARFDAGMAGVAVHALAGLIQAGNPAPAAESHVRPASDQELSYESESQRADLDDIVSPDPSAGPGARVFIPQEVDVLAGMAPLSLLPVEQGIRIFLDRIDGMSEELTRPSPAGGLARWLAGGLVAAAAFELALWHGSRRPCRGLFAMDERKASTWTWLRGRSKSPWLENQ